MTLSRGFIRNAVTTPLDARLMDMAKLVCNSDGSPRVGIIGSNGASPLATTSNTSPMTVNAVANEYAVSKGKADGVCILVNDGTVSIPITAAPGSNSRITVIWVKQNDDTTGDANALPVFGTTDGSAAASPVKPAIPTGALELGTLRVYAGTTASNGGSNVLSQTAQFTAARGASVLVRNDAEREAWTNPVAYQEVYVSGSGKWMYIGGWTPMYYSQIARLGSNTNITNAVMTVMLTINLGAEAPPGMYLVRGWPIMWASGASTMYRRLRWGGSTLTGSTNYITPANSVDAPYPIERQVNHAGGAVAVDLSCQVNGTTPSVHAETVLEVQYLGRS